MSSFASTFNTAQKQIKGIDGDISKVEKSSQKTSKGFNSMGDGASKTEKQLKSFDKEIKNVDKSSDKASKSFLGFGEGVKKVFKVGAGLLASIGIAGALGQSIELASSLSEVQNVVDTTFASSSVQIDTWSKTALNSFGLSELQAKQFSGTMGAMLKSTGLTGGSIVDMSKKLTGLSGDIASFYNISQEDAFEKIRSGISGEAEPLKALGINMSVANMEAFAMSQGIKTAYSKMSQAQQATLRYNYILKATKDVQGDFSKTSGGFANQLRLAKTNIQQMGASIASHALPFLSKLLQLFNRYVTIDSLNMAFVGIIGTIKKLGPLKSIVSDVITQLIQGFTSSNIGQQPTIWQNIGKVVHTVINLIRDGMPIARHAIMDLWVTIEQTAKFVMNNWPTIKAIILGIGGAAGTFITITKAIKLYQVTLGMARKVIDLVKNSQQLLNIVMGKNPVLMIVIAIAALVGIFIYLYKTNDKVRKAVNSAFNSMKNGVSAAFKQIKNVWQTVLKPAFTAIGQFVKTQLAPLFKKAFNTIGDVVKVTFKVCEWAWNTILKPIFNILLAYIENVLLPLWKFAFGAIATAVKAGFNVISNLWNNSLKPIFNGILDFISGVFTGNWSKAWNGIKEIFGGIWNGLKETIKAPLNFMIEAINFIIRSVNKLNINVPSILGITPGFHIGFNIPEVPKLATGGYIKHRPGGILANIGEGKEDEVVTPLSKLKGMMNSSGGRIVYNPQIIIQGNASKEDVQEALDISQAKFNRMMDKYFKNKNRVAFD